MGRILDRDRCGQGRRVITLFPLAAPVAVSDGLKMQPRCNPRRAPSQPQRRPATPTAPRTTYLSAVSSRIVAFVWVQEEVGPNWSIFADRQAMVMDFSR